MWRSLKNFFYSLWTYSDLSPDTRLRRRVNRALRNRPQLNATDWHTTYWQPVGVARSISDFVYSQMELYSGLTFGRVQPDDRFNDDLHLGLVCWFDWELDFCEDFWATFSIDLTPQFNPNHFDTVKDLMLFLNQQVLLTHPL